MALTPEQRAELQRQLDDDDKAQAAEADAFEVEWWTENADGTRRGGRMPWTEGKKIYGNLFPDLFGEKPPAAADDKGVQDGGEGKPAGGSTRFGRRVS